MPMKTIKQGMHDEAVKVMQTELSRLGYNLTADGAFGPGTLAAVKDFQHKHGLSVDGIAGYSTWEAVLFADRPAQEKLTEEDFVLAARLLDCEVAALKAVQKVETGGRGGFFAPGKPAILFEGHVFWKQLRQRGLRPEKLASANPDILYPKWTKSHYQGGLDEYARLEKARKIHPSAANASASWGMFQVMGFHFATCGFRTVGDFVAAMCESERRQLLATCRFISKTNGMLASLRAKKWATFASLYNGSGYAENQYDRKLQTAYLSFLAK